MSARLTSDMRVRAVIRAVQSEGGFATVLARGESTVGGILLMTLERGENPRFHEAGIGPDGRRSLLPAGPAAAGDAATATDYWRRRRARDPDLWVVELDIARAERFGDLLVAVD